jgi:hypothetical protein
MPPGPRPDGVFGARYLHVGNIRNRPLQSENNVSRSRQHAINDTLSRLLNDPDCRFLSFEMDALERNMSLPITHINPIRSGYPDRTIFMHYFGMVPIMQDNVVNNIKALGQHVLDGYQTLLLSISTLTDDDDRTVSIDRIMRVPLGKFVGHLLYYAKLKEGTLRCLWQPYESTRNAHLDFELDPEINKHKLVGHLEHFSRSVIHAAQYINNTVSKLFVAIRIDNVIRDFNVTSGEPIARRWAARRSTGISWKDEIISVLNQMESTDVIRRAVLWVQSNLTIISDNAEQERQRFLFHDQSKSRLSAFWPFTDEDHWKSRHYVHYDTDSDVEDEDTDDDMDDDEE